MSQPTSKLNKVAPELKPAEHLQEIRARIKGHLCVLEVEPSLAQFRLGPTYRPLPSDTPVSLVFEIKCTDGLMEIPAQAAFVTDSDNGMVYKLYGLTENDCQALYNHFDNLVEGIEVSRQQLLADRAPQMEVRDFQLVQKNGELSLRQAPQQQPAKQWILSGLFLIIIGFFGWLLFASLYNIVVEDWRQQEFYTHVASARLDLAQAQLQEIQANLDFTRDVLAKMEDPQYKKDISPIQEAVFRRDLKVLEAHEKEMQQVIGLLQVNQAEVAKGNFFYERRVLDAFTTQERQSENNASAQLLMK